MTASPSLLPHLGQAFTHPNEAMISIHPLQPTGHATHGFSEFDGFSRVSRLLSGSFEPGARTAWPIEEIRPGDVIWFPSGEKHWHGATPTTATTHIAIQEKLDGKVVEWMEHVTDEQFNG
jgi:hypothetical protein